MPGSDICVFSEMHDGGECGGGGWEGRDPPVRRTPLGSGTRYMGGARSWG